MGYDQYLENIKLLLIVRDNDKFCLLADVLVCCLIDSADESARAA
jgi:hypothetical protein